MVMSIAWFSLGCFYFGLFLNMPDFDANMHPTSIVHYSNNNTSTTTNSSIVIKKRKKLVQSTLDFDRIVSRELKPTKVSAKNGKASRNSKQKKLQSLKKQKLC